MDKEELIEQIIKNIEVLGVDFRKVEKPLDGPAACVNVIEGIGAYDPSRATAFDLAHEMFHVMNHDASRMCDYDCRNPAERLANEYAVKWLWDEFIDFGGLVEYFQQFIEVTGCPFDLAYKIIKKSVA